MLRGTVAALVLVALLLPLGVTADAGPGGDRALPGSGLPSGGPVAGPGADTGRVPTPSRPAPGAGAREIPGGPLPGRSGTPDPRAPNAGSGPSERAADPVRPGQTGPEATRDPTAGPRGIPSLGLARRAPSLSIRRDPSTAPVAPGAPPGSAPAAAPSSPLVTLSGHSVTARIVDGVAVTRLEQVFHNRGTRIAQGTWSCPLPPNAVVTGFSIFINGVEHPGRFMLRTEARRIYDETVRSRMDPGIVELHEGNLVLVQIFPIPANGDMKIRMTWAHPLPESGSASHYVAPLVDLVPAEAPPLANLNLAVQVESDWSLRRVLTPEISLEAKPTSSRSLWRGVAALEDCRPDADLEVGYLVEADEPHFAVRTEDGGVGKRYFLAVIQAGSEPLRDVRLDFGGGRVLDQFPSRIDDLAPRSRVLVFGRVAGGGHATLRAQSGRDAVALPVKLRSGDEGFVRALWGVRKHAEMEERHASEDDLLDLAEEAGILTRHNAILAEE